MRYRTLLSFLLQTPALARAAASEVVASTGRRAQNRGAIAPKRAVFRRSTAPGIALLVAALLSSACIFFLFSAPLTTPRHCHPAWVPLGNRADPARIAIVTLQDTRQQVPSKKVIDLMALPPSPGPLDILAVTWGNKAEYAAAHGYCLVNATSSFTSHPASDRPASWNKLRAVMEALPAHQWVFWLDADTVVTNPSVRLEELLPGVGGPDLVLTSDASGVNAGAWMVRNSSWARAFLERWWSSSEFVRAPGDSKSGDNDALKHLLAVMPAAEHARHVGVAPQCAFNSYMWRHSLRQMARLLRHPRAVSLGTWHRGDFIVHLAGFRDKFQALLLLSKQLQPWRGWVIRRQRALYAHSQ